MNIPSNLIKFKVYFFYGIMFLIVVFCIELLSQLTFFIIFGKKYSPMNLKNYIASKYNDTDVKAEFMKTEIIHPYVGYVYDYKNEKDNYSTHGFFTATPLVKREEGTINIVVLGGSVAKELTKYIEQSWKKTFRIKPRLINLAIYGYKEPQQLLALTYFLALGAEYDLVINIDGFNDIVLPYAENYAAGINPFFPRSWKLMLTKNPTHKELALVGKLKYFQDIKRERLAELSGSIFHGSATYGVIKTVQLMINNQEIYDSYKALLALQRELPKRFDESGPVKQYADAAEMHADAAAVWYRSSLLINSLAKDNGFEYYHFLQPDQYLEGSKRLTGEEQRLAFNAKHMYRQSVVIGYPMLIDKGKMLEKNQVNFFDATMIFAKVAETVYCDDCCHFNKRGNQILADYIIQQISRHNKLEKLQVAGALPD
ncbi:MAG: hypothetical protein C4567_10620 [Deltaproteobacteria bacterium]|nr:MAG: hypothetical protein C4567_10620 [Deltaproteobacteria bacterium]